MDKVDHREQAWRRSHEDLVKHLKTFQLRLRFSAGIWYFAPSGGRFHDRYTPGLDIPARLEIAARLKGDGLSGMEAHYPNEINENNLPVWKQFVRDTGIRVVTVVPLLFFDSDFEWGSLSLAPASRASDGYRAHQARARNQPRA